MLPTSRDITLECDPYTNRLFLMCYISISIELSAAFTPAVLEAVELHISRRIVDEDRNLVFGDGIFNFQPISEVFNQTAFFDEVLPLMGSGRQYQYVVSK